MHSFCDIIVISFDLAEQRLHSLEPKGFPNGTQHEVVLSTFDVHHARSEAGRLFGRQVRRHHDDRSTVGRPDNMWNSPADNTVKEELPGIANYVTMIVPFFVGLVFGRLADKVHDFRHRTAPGVVNPS